MSSLEAAHLASFGRQILVMANGIAATVLLQRALRRTMDEERRERGWCFATWASAVYALGPLSMLGFCWVTRRHRGVVEALRALGAGVLWVVVLAVVIGLVDLGYAMAFGLEP